jgi:hypothetical protein
VDVLDLVGSPKRVDRRQGQDRWTYRFYERGENFDREVRFSGTTVVYKGLPIWPPISAEEQDRIFAEQNEVLARQVRQEEIQRSQLPTFTDFEDFIKGRNRVRLVAPETPVEPGTRVTR